MSLVRRSAWNFSVQLTGFGLVIADRILFTGLLIRAWGVEGFSDWASLIAASSLVASSDLGFQNFLGTMLARARARGHERAFNRLARWGLFFYLVVAGITVLTVAALVALFDVQKALSLHGSGFAATFLVLATHQTLRVSRNSVAQLFRGMGETHRLLWADVRSTGVGLLLAGGAVLAGANPFIAALMLLGAEIMFGIGWAFTEVRRRYVRVSLRPERPSRQRLRKTARELRWYSLQQMLAYLLTNLPVLIIGWTGLQGAALVAFVTQRTLVNIGRTAAGTLSQAVGVELADASHASGSSAVIEGVFQLGRLNGAWMALVAAGLLVFGKGLIGIWTGVADLGSLPVLGWLLLPLVVVAPAVPLQMMSLYGHLLRPQAIAAIVQASIALPAALVAGSAYGIVGVAAALAVGEIIGSGIVAPALTARRFAVPYFSLLRTTWLVWLAAFVWSVAVGVAIEQAIPGANAVVFLSKILLWGIVAGLPTGWFAFTAASRRRLAALLFPKWVAGAAK